MKSRLSELDALRGIAALMVVIRHYTFSYNEFYPPIDWPFTFSYGRYGVQLFFLISGFVIFLTLNKSRHSAEFLVSRFSRLYPAYWFSVLLTFAFISGFSLPSTLPMPSVYDAIINLTMVQRWLRVGNIDGVYWTLAVELSFYFIMFLAYLTKQLKRIELWSVVYLCFIVLMKLIEDISGFMIVNAIKVSLLLDYGNLFIAGCLSAEYFLHPESNFLVAVYFLIFYLFTQGWLKFVCVKPLLFLGSISYSLYLTHQIIGYILIDNLYRNGLNTPWLLLVITLMAAVALASFMRVYIEKPAQSWIRKYWHRSATYQAINVEFGK